MKIIGLDLSITGTGFCCVHPNGEWMTENFGTQPDYGHHMERIGFIVNSIKPYFNVNTICFIEDYAYGKSPSSSTLAMLAELGGVIKYHIWANTGIYPFLINQSTIKKWLGAGNMKKGDMPKAAIEKYGIELKTHDEYVALTIVDIGSHLLGRNIFAYRELDKKEMEVTEWLHKKYSKKISLLGQETDKIDRIK